MVKMDEVGADKIKNILKTQILEPTGRKASGCINEGEGYRTDHGLVFIKKSSRPQAKIMFESEVASLSAIEKTRTIRVPHPYGAVEGSNNKFYCVLEFLDLRSSTQLHDELGENLAKLHLHNENVAKHGSSELPYVKQFGFFQTTCIGALPFDNTWEDDWPTFYTKRLQQIVTLIVDKEGPGEIVPLWNELSPIIPKFFENIDVKPSLLHGDLWGGNAGETDTEPVIFDPGSLYGHHEFDIAMTSLFGGFRKAFYNSYHQLIPKAHGFHTREKLYQLFHVMNHWRHFGGGYKSQSLISMRDLIKTKFPLRS